MTEEQKQLLLKDLCARLPYGIKCTTKLTGYNDVYAVQGVYEDTVFIDCPVYEEGDDEWMIESIIPFLRPMSSMTEEEKEYIKNRWCYSDWDIAGPSSLWREKIEVEDAEWIIDYFNEHHFDYRNLIFKGLALEAPEGMYN